MRTKIIVEIASCHNGDIRMAKALIRAASDAGADIVKFQSWKASDVKNSDPDKARYEELEFKDEWHKEVIDYCHELKVEFLTTIYDRKRIPFLKSLGLDSIKVASYNLNNYELLKELKKSFKKIYLSMGGAFPEEIKKAIRILKGHDVTLLHCILAYPTSLDQVNLGKIEWLKKLGFKVGWSDHTIGVEASKVAIAMGVDVVERHFTLSRYLPQTKHRNALKGNLVTTHEIAIEPHELKIVCDYARLVEKIRGDGGIQPLPIEIGSKKKYEGRLGN